MKNKSVTKDINKLLGITESYKAPEALMKIIYDKDKREKLFKEMLELFNYDVSYDWFHEYYQEEQAERKSQKQDFTPNSIAHLVSELVGNNNGNFYEPCAGTGGMTIAAWNRDRMQHSPFDYKPSWYFYTCEELSDRAMPFLLFNLIIRGMNAVVVHCDVLSRQSYGAFFIQNENDDHLQFSSFNVLPYNESVAKTLAVNFTEGRYEQIIESPGIPKHLQGVIQQIM